MNTAFAVLFTLVWSAFVLIFDVVFGISLWHQFESRYYSSTTGRITHSELTHSRTSKGGTAYDADIHYHYEVSGQAFDGTRVRYSPASSSRDWAAHVVDERPVGSETQVYFNPRNPGDSLLLPGWDGLDVFSILFLLPFNMVALGFWISLAGLLRERLLRPIAGGVRIMTDGVQTRIRLPQYSPILCGAIGTGGTSFVSIFIVGFPSGFHPSFGFAAAFLFLAIAGGIGAYVWQWRKIRSGDDDLIINEASGIIELPETYGRKKRISVNASDIAGITVEAIAHRGSKGGVSYTYAPTLQLRHSGKKKIADWGDKMKADAFSEWLRNKLGLKALDLEDQRLS